MDRWRHRPAMSLKKLLERDVRVWLGQSAKDALQFRQPRIGAAERGSVHDPAIPGRVDRDVARRREAAKEDRGFAMNELGAQLDRERSESLDIGQDATALLLARFEDGDLMAVGRELGRGGEAGGARTDDQRVCLFDMLIRGELAKCGSDSATVRCSGVS